MSKAEVTRQCIIEQAAVIFNQHGYKGTSLSEIMQATGLKKGGIYNHFRNKDELAIAAFDYAVQQLEDRYRNVLRRHRHAINRLQMMVERFAANLEDPPLPGGCPILNTAVDSDDTHSALRQRTQQAMDTWQAMIEHIITRGIQRAEIQAVDVEMATTVFISVLEGGLMMSKLYGNPVYLDRAQQHLFNYIETNLKPAESD